MYKKLFVSVALLALVLCGCSKNDDDFNYSDGTAGFVASEIASMNSSTMSAMDAALFRTSAIDDTIEIIVTPWHLDVASQTFIREATQTYSTGQRHRVDTLYVYDNDSTLITSGLSIATVKYLHHARHVTMTNGENSAIVDLSMDVVIHKETADTFAVRNGRIDGSYNGDEFTSTRTVTNVSWRYENGYWNLWPYAGTIDIDRPLRTINISFDGDYTCTITVTRKRDGESKTIIVNLITGEETVS
jgi:hypothetical protein